MRPHRRQPTRLLHPWDSPGKNTGVGCHFLLQCRKVKSESEVAQSYPTLSDPVDYSLPGSSIHGIFQARVLEWGAILLGLRLSIGEGRVNFSIGATMLMLSFLCRWILIFISSIYVVLKISMCIHTYLCIHIYTYNTCIYTSITRNSETSSISSSQNHPFSVFTPYL